MPTIAAAIAATSTGLLSGAAAPAVMAQTPPPPATLAAPPQDQGLPYTRSAHAAALARIRNNRVAVFPGSGYAYVEGFRVRLDDSSPEARLHTEAVEQNGVFYVPASFVGVLQMQTVSPEPAPDYLADRWVYALPLPPIGSLPGGVKTITIKGQPFVDLAGAARAFRWSVSRNANGLLLIGKNPKPFGTNEAVLLDSVVTLFDTPDKLADPDIATRYIPSLKAQGKWTEHVKATPAQIKLLAGPETEWPTVPISAYDFSGFNTALLGSTVPPPGVYPRLLFSREDIPAVHARMQSSKIGQKTLIEWEVLFNKTWWNPNTGDGKLLVQLAGGSLQTLPADHKPDIYTSHVNYVTNCLTTMALYCLLTGDDAHGKQAADALVNYYRLVEPQVDELNMTSDSEFGVSNDKANFAATGWRGMHGVVAHMDLAFALDFGGKWMTEGQKNAMRRFIAKATYGRRDNMQAAPARVKDINHMTWHLTNYLAASVIEGSEGCDPEVLQAGKESARAFCDWGVDENGQIFESNGKSGGGLQFQILTMNVLARRGLNLWGHPHWRKLLTAQVQTTAPNGGVTVSSGTYGGTPLSFQTVSQIKGFYPGDKTADYLLTQAFPQMTPRTFDLAAYHAQLEKTPTHTRLAGPTYPGFVLGGLYDTDWEPVSRADLHLPTTWSDPIHGILSAASDATPNAAWLCLHVRANQYVGAGHHHADVGMFYFSALGVNWFGESTDFPFNNSYDGKYHNEVLIDGLAEPAGLPARGEYLGAAISPLGAFGAVNQTRSYSFRWTNQVMLWNDTGTAGPWSGFGLVPWELETDDPLTLSVYRGTERYKSRAWWPTYNFSNWVPVVRTSWNPVRYAYRTAGLVRGPHPYAVLADDLKKNDAVHLYEWSAMAGDLVAVPGMGNPSDLVLARKSDVENGQPKSGTPLLLVRVFDADGQVEAHLETVADGPKDRQGKAQPYSHVVAGRKAVQVNFKTLLLPFSSGEPLPATTFNARTRRLRVEWPNQTDEILCSVGDDQRTRVTVRRSGREIVAAH